MIQVPRCKKLNRTVVLLGICISTGFNGLAKNQTLPMPAIIPKLAGALNTEADPIIFTIRLLNLPADLQATSTVNAVIGNIGGQPKKAFRNRAAKA